MATLKPTFPSTTATIIMAVISTIIMTTTDITTSCT